MQSSELKKNANIVKGSILSILCGFIIAGIVIACLNVNPFAYFGKMFELAFNPLWKTQTFQWTAIYVVAGLSVGVGFAAGLFNIGVAGQMLSGAALSTIVVNLMYPTDADLAKISGAVVFLVFIICVVMATLMAVISGWLKTQFNIHEVVSTIMLNWIVWYAIKFVFLKWGTQFARSGVSTNPFPGGLLDWGSSQIAVPLIVAAVCVVFVWALLRKTVFGFKVKAVGYSQTVAKYAGVNVTHKVIATMAISGFLAGVASFLNLMTISPNIFFGIDNLPTVGYDAIAVTLVAFNNAWGIVIVGLLWAIAQSAGTATAALYTLPSQMSLLIFGFIVYFAAISIVFIRWHPIRQIRLWWFIHHSPTHKAHIDKLHNDLLNYRWWKRDPKSNMVFAANYRKYQADLKKASTEKEKADLTKTWDEYRSDFKEQNALKAGRIENEIKNYKVQVYDQEMEAGKRGLKLRARNRLRLVDQNGLELVANSKLSYVKAKNNYQKYNTRFTHHYQTEIREEKIAYRKDRKALQVWREGEVGKVKGNFDFANNKITLKGEYQKRKNTIHEDKKNARSEERLALHLIRFDETLTPAAKKLQNEKTKANYQKEVQELHKARELAKQTYHDDLKKLKLKHQETLQALQTNPAPLKEIEASYKLKLKSLEQQHKKNMMVIYSRNEERCNKIDVKLAKQNLQEGQKIANECLKKLTYFKNKPKSTEAKINKLNEEIRLINETIAQVNKHFGGVRFKEFDDNHIVNQKTRLLKKLLHKSYELNVEKDIVMNNVFDAKTKKMNHAIDHDFQKYLHKNPNLEERGWAKVRVRMKYDPATVKNDQIVTREVNEMIQQLENKYTTQEGK